MANRYCDIVKRSICIAGLTLMLASNAVADQQRHSSTLQQVYPFDNGDFALIFDVDSAQRQVVSTPKYMYVVVGQNGVTAEGSSKIYAAALMAMATQRVVNVVYDDSTPNCYINRLSVVN